MKQLILKLGLALAAVCLSWSAAAQHGGAHPGGGWRPGGGHPIGGGHPPVYGGGWHGGGGWHDGWGWWGLGLGIGLGWDGYWGYPYYYYPYPYYPYYEAVPPVVVVPSTPAPVLNWYYCDSARDYYPRVPRCPEPWRVVPAVPPP